MLPLWRSVFALVGLLTLKSFTSDFCLAAVPELQQPDEQREKGA